MKPLNPLLFIPETTLTHGRPQSDPLSLLYILTSAMGVGIFRGALNWVAMSRAGCLLRIQLIYPAPRALHRREGRTEHVAQRRGATQVFGLVAHALT